MNKLSLKTIILLFMFNSLNAACQTISNVYSEQDGSTIRVHYSLSTTVPCEIEFLVSQDGGATWEGPLTKVQGSVGKGITGGEHHISWQVLEEMLELEGDNIKFRIAAYTKKPYEPEMVLVEGGRFMMGNNNGEDDEKPEHEVKLSPYYIGKFEISQTQWVAIMGNNPSYFKDCDQCPVENVSWLDVDEFIKKINKQTGKNYRLPTEAEWEFAARGGNITKGCLYSGGNDLGNLAWYTDNCGGMTHSAGSKKPNELGVFDMSGNVWEWCNDWYGPYSGTSSLDPQGISSGHAHVIRGGGWNMDLSHCRVSTRDWNYPDLKNSIIGFRLASSKDR